MQDDRHDALILFGSQTGVALGAARLLQSELRQAGVTTTLACLNQYEAHLVPPPPVVVIVSSTFLSGGAPDNATRFRAALADADAVRARFQSVPYAVLGIGHSSWPDFCSFTKEIDERLEQAGARRLQARLDADSADEEGREAAIGKWIRALRDQVVPLLERNGGSNGGVPIDIEETGAPVCRPEQCCELSGDGDDDDARWDAARRLFGSVHRAVLVHSARLGARVLHLELAVPAHCQYEPGDCVAIPCANPPAVVRGLLGLLAMDAQTPVSIPFLADKCSLSWALTYCLDLCAAPTPAVLAAAGRAGLGARNALDLYGRCPWLRPTPDDLVQQLSPLAPRYYSIASSPSMHPGHIHLTVAVQADERARPGPGCRPRRGLCTSYLESCHARQSAGLGPVSLPLFVRSDRQLRLPCLERPRGQALVMIGCGVGIAPFRGFLQHIPEGSVRAYLFFGFRDDRDEYLYRDEWRASASIEFIEVAFSRSPAARFRHVQDALKARAADLIELIESGAIFYVCGSLAMAAGVYDCFVGDVLGAVGGLDPSEAVKVMEAQIVHGRYMVEAWD